MKKTLKVFTILICMPLLSFTQESELGNWWIYFGNKKLNENFNLHHEVQYRNYNVIGNLEQLLLRTGIGHDLTENNNNILLGYGFILSENYIEESEAKKSLKEHRIYQQFITKQSFGRIKLQHRYRFEQRWVEEDFKMRFRYFLSTNIPINNKEIIEKTLYFSAYNEIFINSKSRAFDRNRLYGGLGYKLSDNIKFELGYMNQFFEYSGRDQMNVIIFYNF